MNESERLRAFDGAVLHTTADDTLEQIVEEARELSSCPIALVSLILRRTQWFRAGRGLPPELELSRATDRCNSFCQFVVASGHPFVVENAPVDERVPKV